MIVVIDELLDYDVAYLYYDRIVSWRRLHHGEVSIKSSRPHLSLNLAGQELPQGRDPHMDELRVKMMNKVVEVVGILDTDLLQLQRFHTNMHVVGNGDLKKHTDGTIATAVLMLGDVGKEAGFLYNKDGRDNLIEFKNSRLIIFDEGDLEHVGVPITSNEKGPRVTVALKFYANI